MKSPRPRSSIRTAYRGSVPAAGRRLRSANLSVVWPSALLLSLRLGHVAALLGLAVPSGAGAVIHFAAGVDPNLARAPNRARNGALARRRRRRRS